MGESEATPRAIARTGCARAKAAAARSEAACRSSDRASRQSRHLRPGRSSRGGSSWSLSRHARWVGEANRRPSGGCLQAIRRPSGRATKSEGSGERGPPGRRQIVRVSPGPGPPPPSAAAGSIRMRAARRPACCTGSSARRRPRQRPRGGQPTYGPRGMKSEGETIERREAFRHSRVPSRPTGSLP